MVEYMIKTPPLERLGAAVAEAVAAGVSAEEMITIIATTLGQQNGQVGKSREFQNVQDATALYDVPAVPDAPPLFTELPEGLIAVPEAAKKHDIPRKTILTWIRLGKINAKGKVTQGKGGPRLLVSESELLDYKDAPKSKGGRPSKKLPSFSDCAEEVVFDGLPPGLIDLPSAARKYSLNKWTLRNWVTKGYLKRYGRLKGSAQGGGFILVGESELRLYMDMPKSKGGRPRKT